MTNSLILKGYVYSIIVDMQIERFVFNMVGENCYLIWDDNKMQR